MISLNALLAGVAVIAFSGAFGYVIGKMSSRIHERAENGEYSVTEACTTCKYGDLYEDEEPCESCVDYSEWETNGNG